MLAAGTEKESERIARDAYVVRSAKLRKEGQDPVNQKIRI